MELINNLQIKQEDFSPQKLRLLEGAFNKGVPGQSLTNSPEQPYAWESPPVYTSVPEAATAIFADMTEEENYLSLLRALKSGTSVVDIASAILYRGFQLGQFNPDLMLLLMEPVMYMIMAIAEKAGIGDVLGYEGEANEEELDPEEKRKSLDSLKETLQGRVGGLSEQTISEIPSLQKQVSAFTPTQNTLSLLDRPEETTEQNLLDRR